MCNSSLDISISVFEENVLWVCLCNGNFGTKLIFYTLVVFLVLGTPIQSCAIWLIVRDSFKPSSVFPVNISIGELCFSFLSCVNLIITSYPTVAGDMLVAFFIGLSWTVRPLLQVCMCIEQYLAVIHPLIFMRYRGILYRIVLAASAWIFAVISSVRLLFIGVEYFPDHVFFMIFCIAVIIISFCCVSVLHALKRPGPGDINNKGMADNNRRTKTNKRMTVENQQKRKAFKIIAHILVSILICYFPQVVAYFMRIFQISKYVYICNAFPSILSFSLTAILFSPLFRMYNEGQLNQITFSKIAKLIKGS